MADSRIVVPRWFRVVANLLTLALAVALPDVWPNGWTYSLGVVSGALIAFMAADVFLFACCYESDALRRFGNWPGSGFVMAWYRREAKRG